MFLYTYRKLTRRSNTNKKLTYWSPHIRSDLPSQNRDLFSAAIVWKLWLNLFWTYFSHVSHFFIKVSFKGAEILFLLFTIMPYPAWASRADRYQLLGELKSNNWCLTILETEEFKINLVVKLMSSESQLPVHIWTISCCIFTW